NEKADHLAKRATIGGTGFNLQKPVSFLKKTLTQLSPEYWQREREEEKTGRYTFDVLPKVALSSGPGTKFYTQLDMAHFLASSKDSDWTAVHVGTPFHYATACPLTLSFHSKTPSTIHKLPWLRNLVSNPHLKKKNHPKPPHSQSHPPQTDLRSRNKDGTWRSSTPRVRRYAIELKEGGILLPP
ncbi:hypothetical protein AVEN_196554-1, partial [Araneus ventricosus]